MEVSQNVCKNVRWVNSVSEDIANLDFEVLFRKKKQKTGKSKTSSWNCAFFSLFTKLLIDEEK